MYSLPKTQPTSSSSTKINYQTTKNSLNNTNYYYPEVSEFCDEMSDVNDLKYTHNMNIDYGKLSKPAKIV